MKVLIILSASVLLMFHVIADNGRDSGPRGTPTLPSFNCTVWEKWLNTTWREISLPHAYDCTKFYECNDIVIIEKTCADRYRTRYDPFSKRCDWNYKTKCFTFYDFSKVYESLVGKQNWMAN
ncbi:hypothetical protein ACKWTF_006235 [Chironomus riparius]